MHVQAVQLMPLPKGVPEQLPVICNGRSGVLALRTQRVMFNGTDMSASRFESACGKGDAKKWKCSVHVEASPGISGAVRLDFFGSSIAWTSSTNVIPRLPHMQTLPGNACCNLKMCYICCIGQATSQLLC